MTSTISIVSEGKQAPASGVEIASVTLWVRPVGRVVRSWLVRAGILLAAFAPSGCDSDAPPPPAAPPVSASAVASALCADGHSEDPPHRELVSAMRLFRDQQYAPARKQLDALLASHPRSASALALRGDATLFDESLDYEEAARESLRFYTPATKLVDGGCEVSRRTEYYLRMGEAYAALRLNDPERAFSALTKAERKWPTSAEIHYNLARVRCGRAEKFDEAQASAGSGHANGASEAHVARKRELDACVLAFERALTLAESPERPLFFRTHRSAEDWIVRSEKQSEFGPLRRDPRYEEIIRIARQRAATDEPSD